MAHSTLSNASVYLEDVSRRTFETIEKMIDTTFDASQVGRGRDAGDLYHCDISVTDIKRVNNPQVYRPYCSFKEKLIQKTVDGYTVKRIRGSPPTIKQFEKAKRREDLNELYLFHGTSEDSANMIIQHGFDTRSTDPNNMYGSGIYFAEKFTKADQYADDPEDRDPDGTDLTVLLCKVLMGNAFECDRNDAERWRQPPCMLCTQKRCRHGWENRYDSVLGSGHNMLFREFVVYNKSQCYPEFIIKYERIGD